MNNTEDKSITGIILIVMLGIYIIASLIVLYQIAIDWTNIDKLGELQKDLIKTFVSYSAFIIIALIIKSYNLENIIMRLFGGKLFDSNSTVTENQSPIEIDTTLIVENIKNEIIDKMINTLLLKDEYIDSIKETEIKKILSKFQRKLLKNNTNIIYKNKIIKFINNKLLKMAAGELEENELKTFFNSYDEELIYEKSKDKKFVVCNLFINYNLVNLSKDTISQTIFTKKYFPINISEYDGEPLELIDLKIIVDGIELAKYKDKSKLSEYFGINKDVVESISISNQDQIPMQLQERIKNDDVETFKEFEISFSKEIIVEKRLKLIIPYDDIVYGHTFHRPMLNYSFRFRDENAKRVSATLRSAFHKKSDDTITVKNTQANEINIILKDDLLLPKEGLSAVSIR